MRKPITSLAVVALCLVPFCMVGCKKDKKDLIIGTWEAAGGELPKGTTMEFTKDGKVITKMKMGGADISLTGSYTVSGDDLKVTMTNPQTQKEQSETDKIKTLTDKEMVLQDPKGKELKLTKK